MDLLGLMRQGRRWLLGCMLTLTLLPSSSAFGQLLSPGELSRAHEGLDNDSACLRCHSSGKRIDNQLCTQCHGGIGEELRAHTGLHGTQYGAKPCGECHIEHRGRDFALIRWPGGQRERFDHKETGWPLLGKHAGVRCEECHKRKGERGAPTLLGLDRSCATCHEDPHEKRFGKECAKCHDEKSWKSLRLERFDHALARFALVGKHQAVACAKCHEQGPEPRYRELEFKSCESCHKDPHAERFGDDCTSCHTEKAWSDLKMRRAAHPGLSILGGHADVRCERCHDRGNDKAPTRGSRCVACHTAVHEARFGQECEQCHAQIRWLGLPASIGLASHGKTAFPLRGEHEQIECAKCHLPKRPPAARYRKLRFGRCLDCHRDPHAQEFAARDGGECHACHDEHGFRPTLFGVDAHATTAFPLLGQHEAVACDACHEHKGDEPRLVWKANQRDCVSCHQNPHGDQFAREMEQGGCAHCHTPSAWNAPSVDHRIWPLTGAHATVQCAACHGSAGAGGQGGSAANYRGVPRMCEGCHEDAHKGQFRLSDPVRACSECHTTTAFAIEGFDHRKLTHYPLEGGHERVACSGCHPGATLRNGETAVRYRLGYNACADCHRNPHAEAQP